MALNKFHLELSNLPDHYYDEFNQEFLPLLAALRMHGFSILRAGEAKPTVDVHQDLWAELSYPSVRIGSRTAPRKALRDAQPGTPDHTRYVNEVLRANLAEQQRLLVFLERFYEDRTPIALHARLILETIDVGETYLRPQGANIRIILTDPETQRRWFKEEQAEMLAFGEFLAREVSTAAR